jgi:type 1 fimbriae regulatory protein FimE
MATQTVLLSPPYGNRSAVLYTLARRAVIKAVKARFQAQGVRLSYISIRDIRAFADAYFAANRQALIEEAMAIVRKVPQLRTRANQTQEKSAMPHAAPTAVNRTLPLRQPNAAYRQREYLTEAEVNRLIVAARKRGRNGPRDSAAILLAYRHGKLCSLRWSQVDLRHGRLHVNRAKGGCESVHPLRGPELRALRQLQGNGPYVFVTEAGTPVTTAWFPRMVQRTGQAAKLGFAVHPHMLRHACGYKLANDGHDTRSLAHYLGHRNLQSTARYTALAEGRFAQFWKD